MDYKGKMKSFKKHLQEKIGPQETEYKIVSGSGGSLYSFSHEDVDYGVGFQGVSDSEVIFGFHPLTNVNDPFNARKIEDNKVKDIRSFFGKVIYIIFEFVKKNPNVKSFIVMTDEVKKNRLYIRFAKAFKIKYEMGMDQLSDNTKAMCEMVAKYNGRSLSDFDCLVLYR